METIESLRACFGSTPCRGPACGRRVRQSGHGLCSCDLMGRAALSRHYPTGSQQPRNHVFLPTTERQGIVTTGHIGFALGSNFRRHSFSGSTLRSHLDTDRNFSTEAASFHCMSRSSREQRPEDARKETFLFHFRHATITIACFATTEGRRRFASVRGLCRVLVLALTREFESGTFALSKVLEFSTSSFTIMACFGRTLCHEPLVTWLLSRRSERRHRRPFPIELIIYTDELHLFCGAT